jgi:hypothetical protein
MHKKSKVTIFVDGDSILRWMPPIYLMRSFMFCQVIWIVASPLACLSAWFCLAVQLMHGEY